MTPDITNHVALAIAALPQQYKNSPNIVALITALINRVQILENTFISLRDARSLGLAFGKTLDNFGSIVGAVRSAGESDTSFAQDIQIRIAQNNSKGTAENLIALANSMSPGGTILLSELFPATIALYLTTNPTNSSQIFSAINTACSAGVRLDYIETVDPTNPFTFDTGNGFGDSSLSGGGIFGGVFDNGQFAVLPGYTFQNTRSLQLNGTNKNLTMGSGLQFGRTTPFSISAWFFQPSSGVTTTWHPIYADSMYNMYITSVQGIWCEAPGTSTNMIFGLSSNAYTAGQWNHLVWTYDGSATTAGMKVYLNGTSIGGPNTTYPTIAQQLAAVSPTIGFCAAGTNALGSGAYFKGSLDELSFWNRSLLASEVSAIWNSGHPGNVSSLSFASALTTWLRMGDGTGDGPTTVYDQVGSNNATGVNLVSGDFTSSVP